jgi:hypothetical protein
MYTQWSSLPPKSAQKGGRVVQSKVLNVCHTNVTNRGPWDTVRFQCPGSFNFTPNPLLCRDKWELIYCTLTPYILLGVKICVTSGRMQIKVVATWNQPFFMSVSLLLDEFPQKFGGSWIPYKRCPEINLVHICSELKLLEGFVSRNAHVSRKTSTL